MTNKEASNVLRLFANLIEINGLPEERILTFRKAYEQAISELESDTRPHGEWNYIQAGMCICPFCGAMPHKLYKNYCAKCGAELKERW